MSMNRVLITGATGFVGCRVAEVLAASDIPIVGMIRSWHKAARLARLPLKLVQGDISNAKALEQAMQGCETVVHCALDSCAEGIAQRRSMVEGTRNVLEAACKNGVKRIVYLSSTAVYGFWPTTGPITEETPVRYTGDAYGDGKIDSEKVALEYYRERGLPVTILRPSLVYGPFETFWAAHLIRCLGANWMTLINGGNGICNSLYIDNLVSAIWGAANTDAAIGHIFVISDGEKIMWKQMIEGHAAAVKNCRLPVPDATREEIAAARKRREKSHNPSSLRATVRLLRRPETRKALRSVPAIAAAEKMARGVLDRFPAGIRGAVNRVSTAPTGANSNGATMPTPVAVRPVIPLSEHDVQLYTCDVSFSIEKARKMLGYEPKIDFSEGIWRTAEWIRWMNL